MKIERGTTYFNVIVNAITNPYQFYSEADQRGYLSCLSDEALFMLCEDLTDGFVDSDEGVALIDQIIDSL